MKKNLLTLLVALIVVFSANAQQNFAKRAGNPNSKSQLGAQTIQEKGTVSADYKFVESISGQNGRSALSEGFEGTTFPPEGWAIINGGDAATWSRYTTLPHTGTASASIVYSATAHSDYLITPKLTVTAGDVTLTAWLKSGSSSYLEPYDVMVSTTGIEAADFTLLFAAPDPGTVWIQKSYDLSAYIGQNIYVAFRSTTTDQLRLSIDDVAGPAIFSVPDDAGVVSIDMPSMMLPGVVIPKATVKNYGSTAQDFSVQLKINDGTTDVYTESLAVTALVPFATIQLTYPSTTAPLGVYTITATVINPDDMDATNDIKTKTCIVANLADAYAGNTTAATYNTINLTTGAFTPVGAIGSVPFPMAEEYNGTNVYRIYSDLTFGTVGVDGTYSNLGTMTGVAGTPTSLAYNWSTNTMYVVVLTATTSLPQLCTLNMTTYALTLIGTGTVGAIIGMDFANDGFLYGPALEDVFYKIDPATGVFTAIGPLGIDINYGQDVSYDGQTGIFYTCTSTATGGTNQFGTYNLTTGAFTSILDLGAGQIATFVITKVPQDAYAVNFTVNDGTAPVAGAQIAMNGTTLTTDATGNATFTFIDGTYSYTVSKFGYTSATGSVTVAGLAQAVTVSLTALTAYDVTFTVSNNIPAPLAGAAILVTEGANTFNGITNASGVYTFAALPIGTYTYSVSLAGYIAATGTFSVVSAVVPVTVTLLEVMVLPFNLAVTNGMTDATLNWNTSTGFSDDFESYDDFSLTFDPWILNDVDAGATYGFSGITFPNSAAPMAGIILNPSATTPPLSTSTHSGSKMIAIFNTTDLLDNDWIIAPKTQIDPNGQVSFFARAFDPLYVAEKFRVFVSTTGTAPANFTAIAPMVTCSDTLWHQYTYSLAAYAGQEVYVGIQCTSADQFILFIDDFNIGQAKSRAFTGYNVYLDNAQVATNIEATTYTFVAPAPGAHTAGVSSVYTTDSTGIVSIDWTFNVGIDAVANNNINIYPNPTKGKISVENVSNANIYITNIMGNIIAAKQNVTGNASFDLSSVAKGIYMVKIVSDNKVITRKVNVIN